MLGISMGLPASLVSLSFRFLINKGSCPPDSLRVFVDGDSVTATNENQHGDHRGAWWHFSGGKTLGPQCHTEAGPAGPLASYCLRLSRSERFHTIFFREFLGLEKKNSESYVKANLTAKNFKRVSAFPVIIRKGVCKKLALAACIRPSQLSQFPGRSCVFNTAPPIKASLLPNS